MLFGAVAIALILGGIFMIATDSPQEGISVDDMFEDDIVADNSDAEGVFSVSTKLYDAYETVVRHRTITVADIINPATGEEVSGYSITGSWDCKGTNIDWTTSEVKGVFTYSKYYGVDDDLSTKIQTFNEVKKDETEVGSQDGWMTRCFVIDDLIPDPMKPDSGGSYAQKTAQDHAMIFVFDLHFSFSVEDIWGNLYDSEYNSHLELRLMWEGSDLEIAWDAEPPIKDPDLIRDTTVSDDLKERGSDEYITIYPIDVRDSFIASILPGKGIQGDTGLMLLAAGIVLIIVLIFIPALTMSRHPPK